MRECVFSHMSHVRGLKNRLTLPHPQSLWSLLLTYELLHYSTSAVYVTHSYALFRLALMQHFCIQISVE